MKTESIKTELDDAQIDAVSGAILIRPILPNPWILEQIRRWLASRNK